MGKVPTISCDKTDGCQMFLSKDSVDVEIITAKSSEMNVMIPNGDEFVSDSIAFYTSRCPGEIRKICYNYSLGRFLCKLEHAPNAGFPGYLV